MRSVEVQYGTIEELNAQVIELPYAGEKQSMFIILPNITTTLQNVEIHITSQQINTIERYLHVEKVNIWLPTFKLDQKFTLNDALNRLDMTDLFRSDKADLSGIDGSKKLYVTKVLHRAYVEVNEEGTEAAGSTAVITGLRSSRPLEPEFRADRPFMFFIRDNPTKMILFCGRLVKP